MADFTPDFSHETKVHEQNGIRYNSVVFGANAPITENDLNAMQSIQSLKIKDLWELFTDGLYYNVGNNIKYVSPSNTLYIDSLAFYVSYTHKFEITEQIHIDNIKPNETVFLVYAGGSKTLVDSEQKGYYDKPYKQNYADGVRVEATCTRDERYGNKTITKREQLTFRIEHADLDRYNNFDLEDEDLRPNGPPGDNYIVLGKIIDENFVMDPDAYIRFRNSRYPESWNYLYHRPQAALEFGGSAFDLFLKNLKCGNLKGYEIGDYIPIYIGNGPYMNKTFEFEIAYIGEIPGFKILESRSKYYAILSLRKAYPELKKRYHSQNITGGAFNFSQTELYQEIKSLVNSFPDSVRYSMITYTFGNNLYESNFWLPTRMNLFGDDNHYVSDDRKRSMTIDFHYPLYRNPKKIFVEDTDGYGSRFWIGGQFGSKDGKMECCSNMNYYVERRETTEENSVIFCFAVS